MKCIICGVEQICRVQCEDGGRHTYKSKRLTIESETYRNGCAGAVVWLDDYYVVGFDRDTEPEARTAAQAYVDELLKHFREGGE